MKSITNQLLALLFCFLCSATVYGQKPLSSKEIKQIEEAIQLAKQKGRQPGNLYSINPLQHKIKIKSGVIEAYLKENPYKIRAVDLWGSGKCTRFDFIPIEELADYVIERKKPWDHNISELKSEGDGFFFIEQSSLYWQARKGKLEDSYKFFQRYSHVRWSGELRDGFIHGEGFGVAMPDNSKGSVVCFKGTFDKGFPTNGIEYYLYYVKLYSSGVLPPYDFIETKGWDGKYKNGYPNNGHPSKFEFTTSRDADDHLYLTAQKIDFTIDKDGVGRPKMTSEQLENVRVEMETEMEAREQERSKKITQQRFANLHQLRNTDGISVLLDFTVKHDARSLKYNIENSIQAKVLNGWNSQSAFYGSTKRMAESNLAEPASQFCGEVLAGIGEFNRGDVDIVLELLKKYKWIRNGETWLSPDGTDIRPVKDIFRDFCKKSDISERPYFAYFDAYHQWDGFTEQELKDLEQRVILRNTPEWLNQNFKKYFAQSTYANGDFCTVWAEVFNKKCKEMLAKGDESLWKQKDGWNFYNTRAFQQLCNTSARAQANAYKQTLDGLVLLATNLSDEWISSMGRNEKRYMYFYSGSFSQDVANATTGVKHIAQAEPTLRTFCQKFEKELTIRAQKAKKAEAEWHPYWAKIRAERVAAMEARSSSSSAGDAIDWERSTSPSGKLVDSHAVGFFSSGKEREKYGEIRFAADRGKTYGYDYVRWNAIYNSDGEVVKYFVSTNSLGMSYNDRYNTKKELIQAINKAYKNKKD